MHIIQLKEGCTYGCKNAFPAGQADVPLPALCGSEHTKQIGDGCYTQHPRSVGSCPAFDAGYF